MLQKTGKAQKGVKAGILVNGKMHIFEPTCAYAWWALRHHFPSVRCPLLDQNSLDKNSGSIAPRVMKFGIGIYLGDIWAGLEGQGHRSNVKVTR